jgi:hypothetical protein
MAARRIVVSPQDGTSTPQIEAAITPRPAIMPFTATQASDVRIKQ